MFSSTVFSALLDVCFFYNNVMLTKSYCFVFARPIFYIIDECVNIPTVLFHDANKNTPLA